MSHSNRTPKHTGNCHQKRINSLQVIPRTEPLKENVSNCIGLKGALPCGRAPKLSRLVTISSFSYASLFVSLFLCFFLPFLHIFLDLLIISVVNFGFREIGW
jgi:hypothetical protein